MSIKKELLEGIGDVISDVIDTDQGNYPQEAVSKGTYVRSKKWNSLGIITDGFYSELDDQKIIIYTVLYLPNTSPGSYYKNLISGEARTSSVLFMDNETEFDLTYFLMIPPANLEDIEIYNPSGEMI